MYSLFIKTLVCGSKWKLFEFEHKVCHFDIVRMEDVSFGASFFASM